MTKTGSGTLTLSGANNSYIGATDIDGGTLAAAGGSAIPVLSAVVLANTAGASLSLTDSESIGSLTGGGASGGNVSLGSNTLTIGTDNTDTTFAGVISGTGSLVKTGTGTVVVSGPNTFTGSTTIEGGTLQLGNEFALGDFGNPGSVAYGNLTVENATLDLNGYSITVGALGGYDSVITDDSSGLGTSVLTTTATSFYGGTIQDGRNGRKLGFAVTSGWNYFAADNTYTGGTSIASGAELVVGDDNAASIEGNVIDNGSLYFCSTENLTVSGVISGSGNVLLYPYSGTVTLSGANTYTGITLIYGETVVASNLVVINGASNLGDATSPVYLCSDPGDAPGVLRYTGNETAPFTPRFRCRR